MDKAKGITWGEIYTKFCKWSPHHAKMVKDYRPWGSTSIVIWLDNGQAYKVKYIYDDKFVMQPLTLDDINRKFGLCKENNNEGN